jgi:LysR family cys regulon transcriptional activator
MKIQQLRYLIEVSKQGLNLSAAAEKLHTSQPGISKQIRLLEEELGVEIFVRNGKSVVAVTPPGRAILEIAQRILNEAENLKQAAQDYSTQDAGKLIIATTHTQARYVLPVPVAKLRELYPHVNISLHQGSPDQVAKMLLDDTAEIGMATESLADYEELVTLPCYEWQHMLVVAPDHPLAKKKHLHLEDIAKEPLITYHPSFTGRTRIDAAFASKKLHPRIALEAIDSDVIKTYVRLGLGVGIVAEMAVKDELAADLVARPLGDLLGRNVSRVAFKRGAYLRNFVYQFAELLSDRLTTDLVTKAMTGHVNDYEL